MFFSPMGEAHVLLFDDNGLFMINEFLSIIKEKLF